MAEDDTKYDNEQFEITNNELFWKGSAVDFETASEEDKIFTIKIERYHNEADATAERSPQTFEYIVNLRDVLPTITGNQGTTTDALPYLAMGNVGDDNFEMIFAVNAEGDTLTIDFERGGIELLGMVAQYVDNDNPSTDTLTGFKIITGITKLGDIATSLNNKDDTTITRSPDPEKDDFGLWFDYVKSVKYIGTTPNSTTPNTTSHPEFFADVSTLTGSTVVVVDENTATTTILANFASADTATWSLTGIDIVDFNIDPSTGEFRFENAPNYETPADANGDNQYRVTINANDGVNTQTFDLLVLVQDVTE